MPEIIGGSLLIEGLKRLGIQYVFGMPGFQLMSVYDAIYKSSGEIKHILVHDEKSGAFMADGYARISGKPGVCDATVGPGATNLVSGVAESFYASTPLVAITSDVRMEFVGKSPNQECDQASIFRPIVKGSYTVHLPERILEATHRAFHLAVSGRPGPVHLNLPENINYSKISYDWEKELETFQPVACPSTRPQPDAALVDKAISLLRSAQRPVCIAGGGVHISQACDHLLQFVEKMRIPVATSLTGKGAIPESHPLSISLCGRFDRYANRFIAESDLILVIGCKLAELVTSRWSIIPEGVDIIHIDVDPFEIHRNYHATIGIVADAGSTLIALLEALGPFNSEKLSENSRVQEIAEARKSWEHSVRNLSDDDQMPTNPARILREIRSFLPEDGLLVLDGGLSTHWAGLFFDVRMAGRGFMPNRGQAAMGYGFPASLGAKLAAPDRAVVSFIGDGGFCMGLAELETAARENIPVIVVVNNNSALGYVKALQHVVFDKRYQSADFIPIRFDRLAENFGCRGVRIEHVEEIVPELKKALNSGRPTVIDIPTTKDPGAMLPTPDARAQRE